MSNHQRQLEQMQYTRDSKLRRNILDMLHEFRGCTTPVSGRDIYESYGDMSPLAYKLVNEQHAMQLLNDLERVGVAQCLSTRKYKNDPDTLDYRTYRITDKGIGLVEGVEPVIPTIDDDRIAPGTPGNH